MKYSEILNLYIERSNLSLGDIAKKMTENGVKVDRSYLSKLKSNSTKNPASEEINRALAKVTGGDAEHLVKAAYIERAREPIAELLEKTGNLHLEELLNPVDFEKDLAVIKEAKERYEAVSKNSDTTEASELENAINIHLENLARHKLVYKGHELSEDEANDLNSLIETTLRIWAMKR